MIESQAGASEPADAVFIDPHTQDTALSSGKRYQSVGIFAGATSLTKSMRRSLVCRAATPSFWFCASQPGTEISTTRSQEANEDTQKLTDDVDARTGKIRLGIGSGEDTYISMHQLKELLGIAPPPDTPTVPKTLFQQARDFVGWGATVAGTAIMTAAGRAALKAMTTPVATRTEAATTKLGQTAYTGTKAALSRWITGQTGAGTHLNWLTKVGD